MKKIVIVCGLISGFIVTTWFLGSMAVFGSDFNFDKGMFYGFASMIMAFSLIFVGIKNYRDNYNNGVISFGKGFQIGFLISLIASTIYVVTWLIMYFNFMQDFDEKYTEHVLSSMQKKGESPEAIDAKKTEMNEMWVLYQNPFICALFTYTEILPVGLVISLIAALILKRKTKPREEVVTP
jgi:hypothetical protein